MLVFETSTEDVLSRQNDWIGKKEEGNEGPHRRDESFLSSIANSLKDEER